MLGVLCQNFIVQTAILMHFETKVILFPLPVAYITQYLCAYN